MKRTLLYTAHQLGVAMRQALTASLIQQTPGALTNEEAREFLRKEFNFGITHTYLSALVSKRLIPFYFAGNKRGAYFIREELRAWMVELIALMSQIEKRKRGATAQAMQEATRRVAERIQKNNI